MRHSFSLLLSLVCASSALGRAIAPLPELYIPEWAPYALGYHAQHPTKLVVTNDDGWAVAQIRAEYEALRAAGYNVVLSAPAQNESGTASNSAPATTLTVPCEFDSCPVGSPAEGFNASDHRLNYVNSFPVDAVRYGINTLAPKIMGSKPDLVFSGINVAGNNIGWYTQYSGTFGAATEAALEGIPSIAFSAAGDAQVSYTTLSNHTYQPTIDANIYSALSLKFLHQLLNNPGPILPANISLNVNFPSTANCTKPEDFKFVLTRIYASTDGADFHTCGQTNLVDEFTLLTTETGCYSSVSVFSATNKSDVGAEMQGLVHKKLAPLLTCLPKHY